MNARTGVSTGQGCPESQAAAAEGSTSTQRPPLSLSPFVVRKVSGRAWHQHVGDSLDRCYRQVRAHGLVVGRSGKVLYVANRNEGTVSVISFRTRKVVAKWRIPGGGSPDMGDVSADGKVLWLSGRYNSEVYAINTRTGKLIARIPVGASPHGLSVWPQPGRYSLGHTRNTR